MRVHSLILVFGFDVECESHIWKFSGICLFPDEHSLREISAVSFLTYHQTFLQLNQMAQSIPASKSEGRLYYLIIDLRNYGAAGPLASLPAPGPNHIFHL